MTAQISRAQISRIEALEVIATACSDIPVVVACAASSREMASIGERPNHFYMYDQLGMAVSIGFGLAMALADSRFPRIIAIEGDGGMLFNLPALATIGSLQPAKLALIVLDNEAYASTGGQATASPRIDLAAIAAAAGISAAEGSTEDELRRWLETARTARGPHFLRFRITPGNTDAPRLETDPPLIAHRLATFLRENG